MSEGQSRRSPISRAHDWIALLLGLIVPLTAIPIGSNRSSWWLLWTAVFAAIAFISIVRLGLASGNYHLRCFNHKGLLGLALVLPLWALVQSFRLDSWLPATVLAALPSSFLAMATGLSTAAGPAISVQPESALSGILRFLGYLLLICLVIEVASKRERVLRIGQLVYGGVCLQAIWAIIALKLLNDFSPWGPKLAYIDSATGTFINRNSLATFLGLGIVLGIGLFGERAQRTRIRASRPAGWARLTDMGNLFLLIGMFSLTVALVYTQSRLGLAASLVGAAVTLQIVRLQRGASLLRVALETVAMVSAAAVAVGLLTAGGGVAQRLLFLSNETFSRLSIYSQTLSLIAVRPWTGFGMDAFASAFEAFRGPPLLAPVTFDLAHNTYLMLWSEFGLIFGSAPLAVLLAVAVQLFTRMRSQDGFPGMAAAALGALVLGAVHSAGDFSLEIPANVYLLVTIIGLGLGRQSRGASAPPGTGSVETGNYNLDATTESPLAPLSGASETTRSPDHLTRLLARCSPQTEAKAPCIVDLGRVVGPIYAIGDVHGCIDLLNRALAAIRKDARLLRADPTVILLGDMVDRGPDSAAILRTVIGDRDSPSVLGVLGNHERMMLSFYDEPARNWDWLHQGGLETLQSYGLLLMPTERLASRRVHHMLQYYIPDTHIKLLNSLPHGYSATVDKTRYLFCHAGLDARVPLESQTESAMLWGRNVSRGYPGLCVVQGHIQVDRPILTDNIIYIDTGACTSGLLTVLRICSRHPTCVLEINSGTS